ncbi:hypothetical protein GCM10022381_30130 [Leifsonia kafniensis]|uniref:Uncharacterized protein n=2 Tax=Leifsonia kafniensis TaxID=475957 RepID=A0ABP7KRA1_9MICO
MVAAVGELIGMSRFVELGERDVRLYNESVGAEPSESTVPEGLIVARTASLMMELIVVAGRKFGLNYGIDDVRLDEILIGSRIRLRLVLAECEMRDEHTVDAAWAIGVEVDGRGAVGGFTARTRYIF